MEIPDISSLNCNTIREKYIKSHYPEFYNHLIERYKTIKRKNLSELLYLFYHNMSEPLKCPVCGTSLRFINISLGYQKNCSYQCAQYNPKTKEKIKVDPIYAYHQANIVMNCYRTEYKDILKDLSEIIYDKNTPQQIETILSSISIIVKYAERNVDHAVNILENFIYVRESNFFFNKHLTQSLDFDDINTSEVYTKKTKSKKQK